MTSSLLIMTIVGGAIAPVTMGYIADTIGNIAIAFLIPLVCYRVIGGYALFYLFKNLNVPHSNLINSVAAGTFGILLIHDHNFLRHLFWNEIIRTQTYYYSKWFALWFIFTVVGIFIACSTIDYIRRNILENNIVNTKITARIIIIDERIAYFLFILDCLQNFLFFILRA